MAGLVFLINLIRYLNHKRTFAYLVLWMSPPRLQLTFSFQLTMPLMNPAECIYQIWREPFRVDVPFRVVLTRKHLHNHEHHA